MRKIYYLYFTAQKAILYKIWLFYCEKYLFLKAEKEPSNKIVAMKIDILLILLVKRLSTDFLYNGIPWHIVFQIFWKLHECAAWDVTQDKLDIIQRIDAVYFGCFNKGVYPLTVRSSLGIS